MEYIPDSLISEIMQAYNEEDMHQTLSAFSKEVEETLAKIITYDTAKNALAIADTLRSIDFLNSKLPEEVLEHKKNPNRSCGDLEFTCKAAYSMLIKNPQTLPADLRKIDEKLLAIAVLLKQSVEQGLVHASYAARDALVRGISEVRSKVPSNDSELLDGYLETNAKYLDSWITLIKNFQRADLMEKDIKTIKLLVEEMKKRDEENSDIIEKWRQEENSPEGEALTYIRAHGTEEERKNWTPLQRKVYMFLRDWRVNQIKACALECKLKEYETELDLLTQQTEVLSARLTSAPDVRVYDGNNKPSESELKQIMEQIFSELLDKNEHEESFYS